VGFSEGLLGGLRGGLGGEVRQGWGFFPPSFLRFSFVLPFFFDDGNEIYDLLFNVETIFARNDPDE
jgi:hypothetical protein